MTTVPVGQLAALLRASAAGYYASEAAADLLIAHDRWLARADFREACVNVDDDGPHTPVAWLDWAAIPAFLERAACSSSEARMLRLAAELAGVDTATPLEDLLSSLDDTNARRVLDAITHTLTHGGTR